jgi:hypothetical protein
MKKIDEVRLKRNMYQESFSWDDVDCLLKKIDLLESRLLAANNKIAQEIKKYESEKEKCGRQFSL